MKTIAQNLNIKDFPFEIHDANGNRIYYEDSEGFWRKYEYNANGNVIYYENSDGYWVKHQYDANGKLIYFEISYGYWVKHQYDSNGNETYFENSYGYWWKRECDSNGNQIYYEDSDGEIIDNRMNKGVPPWINEDVKLVNEDESARQVLEGMGYYVRNLWSVSDVNGFNGKVSKEEALKILASALTHPYTMEVVFDFIEDGVRGLGYEIEDES